jgi:UDP-N-acetylglucosamine--N-acetylmuramyl-(pentapeptide) pyrophosphoryl-undecaprenol N-acetylglucosamine transferase
MIVGFFQSVLIIARFRPRVIVNAGSFVGLPVIVAGWLLRVRCVIVQLDLKPVLTNVLTAPFATALCVSLEDEKKYFPSAKTVVTGVPLRRAVYAVRAKEKEDMPMIYITGGSGGSSALNEFVFHSLNRLCAAARVVHITGKNKGGESRVLAKTYPSYHPFELLGDECIEYAAAADVVVARAGIGTLAELSALGKPAIVIPLPSSPQEDNAAYFQRREAVIALSQKNLTADMFTDAILHLLHDEEKKQSLARAISTIFPPHAASRVADVVRRAIGRIDP